MAQYTVEDLISEYIYQREHKVSREQAIKLLLEMEPNLQEQEQQQLKQMIRQWESQHQEQPAPPVSSPPDRTEPVPPLGFREMISSGVPCRHCSVLNPAEAKYCYACGQLLAEPISDKTDHLPEEAEDPALFGTLATLILIVRNFEQHPLRIQVGNQPMVIGRSEKTTSQQPEIDFAPFNAKDLGVSRRHAVLKRENQTLTLMDQGSVNHTYINGEKVHPHEVRVIRDGDEIRFGRLPVRVHFHRQLRRL